MQTRQLVFPATLSPTPPPAGEGIIAFPQSGNELERDGRNDDLVEFKEIT